MWQDVRCGPVACQQNGNSLASLRQLYYLFATSQGQASDPVVLWLNGASSQARPSAIPSVQPLALIAPLRCANAATHRRTRLFQL